MGLLALLPSSTLFSSASVGEVAFCGGAVSFSLSDPSSRVTWEGEGEGGSVEGEEGEGGRLVKGGREVSEGRERG